MKNMKKQLACSVLCLALLLIMMLGTTVAWFSDSASNVNTMVVGKISITQTVQDAQVVVMPTVVIDRTVTVTNDGNQPAYARTLIAFEDKSIVGTDKSLVQYLTLGDANVVIPGVNVTGDKVQFAAADGTLYTIGYYVHTSALTNEEAGKTYTCLKSITLNPDAPSEWHEAAGTEYQILVLSQAVQTAGLTGGAASALNTVFGEVNASNVGKWFTEVLNAQANP